MKKLILINLYLFLFWLVSASFSNFDLIFLKYLESFSILIITLWLTGFNLTALIQLFLAKPFSKIETLSVASISAIIVAPLLVTLEYSFWGLLSPKLPFINSIAIFILLLIVYSKKKSSNLKNFDFLKLNIKEETITKLSKSPFLFTSIIYFIAVVIIFSAFYALPEFDPYYWYSSLQELFSKKSVMQISGYRPLFSSLIYILNQTAKIDFYAIFKYVLPLLTSLVLIPSILVASNFKGWLQKFLISILAFASASTFIYSQMPIPQLILNITLFYFTFFLIYSWATQKTFFYFLAGIIGLFAYFYHESAMLFFSIWFVSTIFFYRKNLLGLIKANRLSSFLIFVIFFLNFSQFLEKPYSFLARYLNIFLSPKNILNFNFLFPAKYSNIDGNLMGWSNSIGVLKYYIYYVGPAFFIIIIYFLYLFFRNQQFKKYTKKNLAEKELLVLFISFLCFFSISEIFPRIFNIALLPERAWIFSNIFSIVFLFLILKHKKTHKLLYFLIIFALFINLGGAIYINNLKKNIVTANTLNSVEWIKKNLPQNRILFSDNNSSSLRLYSQSIVVEIPNEAYFDIDICQKSINQFKHDEIRLNTKYQNFADEMINNVSDLGNYKIKNQKNEIDLILNKNSAISEKISNLLSLPSNEKEQNLFVYFQKISKNNPYINRPYCKKSNLSNDFIFDKYPKKFRRIYQTKNKDIIIWKIL